MNHPNIYKTIVRQGLQLLITEKSYTQKEIFDKLKCLDMEVSKASLSNLWKAKGSISPVLTKKAAQGILKILKIEQCLEFDEAHQVFVSIDGCQQREILTETPTKESSNTMPFQIYDGRRDVHQKIAFYQKAKTEVLELGIRLRNFMDYFNNKRDGAFRDPLRDILAEGVCFKCCVLDPEGNFAQRYFTDRALVQPFEKEAIKSNVEIIKKLELEFIKLNREGHEGRMELWVYDHFPYFHATAIDGDTERGELLIAPYLYGVTRANTPVIEVAVSQNKKLYKRYWQSVEALLSKQANQRV